MSLAVCCFLNELNIGKALVEQYKQTHDLLSQRRGLEEAARKEVVYGNYLPHAVDEEADEVDAPLWKAVNW